MFVSYRTAAEDHVMRRLGVAVLAAILIASTSPPARAGVSQIYLSRVKPALALVETTTRSGKEYGTAFCIGADAEWSYFLTAQHVIAPSAGAGQPNVSLIFPDHPQDRVKALVVRPGSAANTPAPDLAVLKVAHIANITPLAISSANPLEGYPAAIAGFPAVQLHYWMTDTKERELRPTLHEGAVDGLNIGDSLVQYDAKTDHGNSGGPLFDAQTGAVYGVVRMLVKGVSTDNAEAISSTEVQRFLQRSPAVTSTIATPNPELIAKYGAPKTLSGPRGCVAGLHAISTDFGDWRVARGIRSGIRMRDALGRMRADVARIRAAGRPDTAALADTVVTEAERASATSAKTLPSLRDAVGRVNDLGDCSS